MKLFNVATWLNEPKKQGEERARKGKRGEGFRPLGGGKMQNDQSEKRERERERKKEESKRERNGQQL